MLDETSDPLSVIHSDREAAREPGETLAGSAPRVLFASTAEDPPPDVLKRARSFARRVNAELHTLRVVSVDAGAEDCESGAHAVRNGKFIEAVARRADDIGAALVITAAEDGAGTRAVTLARASGRPILVARPSVAAGRILAATDLSNPRFPVLRHASQLGNGLQAHVMAVHNIAPSPAEALGSGLSRSAGATHLDSRLESLAAATRELEIRTLVMTRLRDPVDAIMSEAQRYAADIIVVGTRIDTGTRSRVAAHVADLSPQSVLLTPLQHESTEVHGVASFMR